MFSVNSSLCPLPDGEASRGKIHNIRRRSFHRFTVKVFVPLSLLLNLQSEIYDSPTPSPTEEHGCNSTRKSCGLKRKYKEVCTVTKSATSEVARPQYQSDGRVVKTRFDFASHWGLRSSFSERNDCLCLGRNNYVLFEFAATNGVLDVHHSEYR